MFHRRRHLMLALLLLIAASALAACAAPAAPTAAPTQPTAAPAQPTAAPAQPTAAPQPTAAAAKPRIAFIQTGPYDYYEYGVQGAKKAAEMLGVDLLVFNSELKPEKEIANVEDAIQQKVDGIILFSVGRASEEAALAKINAAGIPVALLYGYDPALESKGNVFVQADITKTGYQIGEWFAKNVKEGKVAVIQGALGRGDAEAYTKGFKDALAATNPNLTVVAEPEGAWDRTKAVAAMEDLLTKYPDLVGVFVSNEDMAMGAISVIKTQGKQDQVTVVSQNGSVDGVKAIEAGDLAATLAWSPSEEAVIALKRLVERIRTGKAPEPKLCHTPTKIITKDNLSEVSPWPPTDQSTQNALKSECAK